MTRLRANDNNCFEYHIFLFNISYCMVMWVVWVARNEIATSLFAEFLPTYFNMHLDINSVQK